MYGITLFSVLLTIAYFIFDKTTVQVAGISLMLHYAADILLGKTRPFYPYSKKEIFLGVCPEKHRMKVEILSIIILGVITWFIAR